MTSLEAPAVASCHLRAARRGRFGGVGARRGVEQRELRTPAAAPGAGSRRRCSRPSTGPTSAKRGGALGEDAARDARPCCHRACGRRPSPGPRATAPGSAARTCARSSSNPGNQHDGQGLAHARERNMCRMKLRIARSPSPRAASRRDAAHGRRPTPPRDAPTLSAGCRRRAFAALALKCLHQEYPNHISHTLAQRCRRAARRAS